MLGIQCSIGALNDVIDEPNDAVEKPRKPIPSGLVPKGQALAIVLVGGATGLVLSAVSGWITVVAAIGCAGLGYLYDLKLSRTALSWLPLSLALPLLPIHAWLGATGTMPVGLLELVPVGVLGGGGLALANGLVDVERDTRAGRAAAAVILGRRRAWLAQTLVLGCAAALAVVVAPAVPSIGSTASVNLGILQALRGGGVALGAMLIAIGAGLLAARAPGTRERGWELEAIGVASLGLAWLAGTAAAAMGGLA